VIGARGAAALVLAALVLSGVSPARAQGRVTAEGIAAIVGSHAPGPGAEIVLRSDAVLRARLDAPSGTAPGEDALVTALDVIVGEVLVAREAERVRSPDPTAAAVAAEVARIEAGLGGAAPLDALLDELGASRDEIRAIAERRARVAGFLRSNIEGTTAITDAEVAAAFDAGGHPWVGRPLDDVRELLRAALARQALDRAVARWVALLRARTVVEILWR
jgi:hypothetical protein